MGGVRLCLGGTSAVNVDDPVCLPSHRAHGVGTAGEGYTSPKPAEPQGRLSEVSEILATLFQLSNHLIKC